MLEFVESARLVRERIDLEAPAEELGLSLRRSRGPCPFCGAGRGRTAFSVRRDRWRCFAFGEFGDAVGFVRPVRGCTSREALAELAREAGRDSRRPIPSPVRQLLTKACVWMRGKQRLA